MGCLTSVNFAILINGTPSRFFIASKGTRQGCPLSPLLFILVIEELSLLLKDAKEKGRIRGIKISANMTLTNLLFVDNVVLFCIGTVDEWMAFDVILETFCAASGMFISLEKSGFLFSDLELGVQRSIHSFLPYKMEPILNGFKYLGYFIKSLGYKVKD